MEQFDKLIARLPEKHRSALKWFAERAGSEQLWPETLLDGTLLASKAKGIYKPNMTLLVSPDLERTEYSLLASKHLRFPKSLSLAPNIEALNQHRSWAGL